MKSWGQMKNSKSICFLLFYCVVQLFITSCAPNGAHKPVVEPSKSVGSKGTVVSFADVKPIFERRCAACHPSKMAPDWTNEQQALPLVKNGKLKLRVVIQKTMPQIGSPQASEITQEERDLIAGWIESVNNPEGSGNPPDGGGGDSTPVPTGDVKWQTVQSCTVCHSANGIPTSPIFPRLAGQNLDYLKDQINQFKEGKRVDPNGLMNAIAKNTDPEGLAFALEYFSAQRLDLGLVSVEPDDALRAQIKRGKELSNKVGCFTCHASGPGNTSMSPMYPNLYGQQVDYTANQLRNFTSGQRPGTVMPTILQGIRPQLTEADWLALGHYFRNL